MKTIQVVGLGLIGGSLCRTIKKRTGYTVVGLDLSGETLKKALETGAIDRAGSEEELGGADLTFVCLHPEATIRFLVSHAGDFKPGSIVADVCGVKGAVVKAASAPCREAGVLYVGCHPMAGREFSGFNYALDTLFDGASFILTPDENTDPAAVRTLSELALTLGFGKTVISTPEEHDAIIAATSQLAHVVSNAYIKSPTLRRQAGFSAGSYLDLTRVAKLNEEMWTSLFLLNREPLLYELDTIIKNLQDCKSALEEKDAPRLKALLREGREYKEADLAQNSGQQAGEK